MSQAARHEWSLTRETFDAFLAALAPDRDTAAERYLEIRRNLVRLFEWRGCRAPEEHADETLNRCARRIAEGEHVRDVATYAVGVARLLLLEVARTPMTLPLDEAPEPCGIPSDPELSLDARIDCLRGCLANMTVENRDLILTYYQGEKGSGKIRHRKALMQMFGIPANTLRMRALRLRQRLQSCVEDCLRSRAKECV